MDSKEDDERIFKFMNDPEKVRRSIQAGIMDALLKHKQAGNPVCGLKDGKIYWIKAEDIVIRKCEA